jgi:hypothetical protein
VSVGHVPAAVPLHVPVSVRTQHVPTVPAGGIGPGEPVALFTQSCPLGHDAFTLFTPQPFGRFVPHWPAPV